VERQDPWQAAGLGLLAKWDFHPYSSTCQGFVLGDFMYLFKDEISRSGFFLFDKKWIEDMHWASLPTAAKAVFPVIASYRNNKTGIAFPDQQTISALSGRTEKNVRKGIKGLDNLPGFYKKQYKTKRGKYSYKYAIPSPPKEKGRAFPFHGCIMHGGNWRELSPSSQTLYPVMRHFGWFDLDMYCEIENIEVDPVDFMFQYSSREFEFCDASLDIMAEHAGLTRRSVYSAFSNLEEHNLIKRIESNIWQVYLIPDTWYKRKFLNKKILRIVRA
jgi:hypothetical protein